MAEVEQIDWPFTDDGPFTDEAGGKRARLRILLSTQVGDNPARPLYGLPLYDIIFEAPLPALTIAVRQSVRDQVAIFEPGIIIPQGDIGVNVEEREEGFFLIVNYLDVDEPELYNDPLVVRLRSG